MNVRSDRMISGLDSYDVGPMHPLLRLRFPGARKPDQTVYLCAFMDLLQKAVQPKTN